METKKTYRVAVTNTIAAQIDKPNHQISFMDIFNNDPVRIPQGVTLYNKTTHQYEDATTPDAYGFTLYGTNSSPQDHYILRQWDQEIIQINADIWKTKQCTIGNNQYTYKVRSKGFSSEKGILTKTVF
jgi:hypothetical protein